jgi:hypothetical protein
MAAGFGIRDSGFRLKKDFHAVEKLERQINKSRTHARKVMGSSLSYSNSSHSGAGKLETQGRG